MKRHASSLCQRRQPLYWNASVGGGSLTYANRRSQSKSGFGGPKAITPATVGAGIILVSRSSIPAMNIISASANSTISASVSNLKRSSQVEERDQRRNASQYTHR